MLIFVRPDEAEILRIGTEYLRIEGVFYLGIGILFLLYGNRQCRLSLLETNR